MVVAVDQLDFERRLGECLGGRQPAEAAADDDDLGDDDLGFVSRLDPGLAHGPLRSSAAIATAMAVRNKVPSPMCSIPNGYRRARARIAVRKPRHLNKIWASVRL